MNGFNLFGKMTSLSLCLFRGIQFSAEVVPTLFLFVDADLRGQQWGLGEGQVGCMCKRVISEFKKYVESTNASASLQ